MSKINLNLEMYSDLTKERQSELAEALLKCNTDQEKQVIWEELTNRHLRLVHKVAIGYKNSNVDYEDLFSAGCLALWRSVIGWDLEHGPLFPWALRWIKTAMNREIDNSRQIRIPEEIAYTRALAEKYKKENDMSDEDIAIKLDISIERLAFISTMPKALNILDTPSELGGGIKDYLSDHKNLPEQIAEVNEIKSSIYAALDLLSPLEREVMVSRFGLDGDKKKTFNEIGGVFAVGREALRRVEAGAIAKMRHPSFPIQLNIFLDNSSQ